MSEELLAYLADCIERGKVDKEAAYPPDLNGRDGASEVTRELLDNGVDPNLILSRALMVGMERIGEKFGSGQAFIPDLLIASKAMYAAMDHLKPYFDSGAAQHKGTIILGTVAGDRHDIGKNLLRMVMEGNGWKAVDLGTNVSAEQFLAAPEEHPDSLVGLSALLTTTMLNMERITRAIKARSAQTQVFVGGAPLSEAFNEKIGADGYFPSPQALVAHLESF